MVSRRVHNFVLKQIYIRHYNRISYFETVQVRHALLPSSSDCWQLECASIGACVGLGCVSLQPILGTLVRLQFTCLALETIALISAMPGMLSVSDPLSALAAHVGCHFLTKWYSTDLQQPMYSGIDSSQASFHDVGHDTGRALRARSIGP